MRQCVCIRSRTVVIIQLPSRRYFTRCSAIAERRTTGCVIVLAKSGRLQLGYNIDGHMSIFNQYCDMIGLKIYRIRWNNAKQGLLRRSKSFEVIKVGTTGKPVCDFLIVINSNWHPLSYLFGVIAAYCSNFGHCVFQPPPFVGAWTTYDVRLGLIGKRVVDFLLVLIELFR